MLPERAVETAKLLGLSSGLFVVGTNALIIVGLLPHIGESLAAAPEQVAIAIIVYAAIVAIASPIISTLAAGIAPRSILVVGALLVAAGTAATAGSPDLTWFTLSRCIAAIGGACLVPLASSTAAAIASPGRTGRAIGTVVAGFVAASALGAPLGTLLGTLLGWRPAMLALALAAVVVAPALWFASRSVTSGVATSLRMRLAVLGDRRIVFALGATALGVASVNVVYVFSAVLIADLAGDVGGDLAFALLAFGAGGLVGNVLGGQLADRVGSRPVMAVFPALQILVMIALAAVVHSFAGVVVAFALWGLVVNPQQPAIQHRIATLDRARSRLMLSWNSTAMYAGMAVAPALGNLVLAVSSVRALPLIAVLVVGLGLLLFRLGGDRAEPAAAISG